MNNSDRTTIIAHGIHLWARVQNLTISENGPSHPFARAFSEWARAYPDYVEFVKREQFALFDRVNAKF